MKRETIISGWMYSDENADWAQGIADAAGIEILVEKHPEERTATVTADPETVRAFYEAVSHALEDPETARKHHEICTRANAAAARANARAARGLDFEVTRQNVTEVVNKTPRVSNAPEEVLGAIIAAAYDALSDIGEYDEDDNEIWVNRQTAKRVVYHLGCAYRDGVRAAYEAMQTAAAALV